MILEYIYSIYFEYCFFSAAVAFRRLWWERADLSGVGPSPCVSVEGGWVSEADWEQALAVGDTQYWLLRPAGPPPRAAGSAAELE